MKQLIITLFVLFSFTISYAQDGKPTKEETLQYIKNELEGREIEKQEIDKSTGPGMDVKIIFDYIDKVTNLEMNSCLLEFNSERNIYRTVKGYDSKGNVYIPKEHSDKLTSKESIDFSRTESIQFGITSQENIKYISLWFKQKKDDGTYGKDIVISIGSVNSDFQDYESLKIYKAFQHLRKLCNAPEPISFD